MKRISSNLLHLSIYQCVIWGITNRFCPHYPILGCNTPEFVQKMAQDCTKKGFRTSSEAYLSDPPGDRTLDPNIKSVVLYQLS